MDVRDVMSKKNDPVVTVDARLDVAAAAALLARHRIGGLPAIEGGVVRGFVSEADIVAVLAHYGTAAPDVAIRDVMRRAPACSPSDNLNDVMARMTKDRLRHLVVMDGGKLAGIISVGDIVKNRLQELETEREVLRDMVAAQRAI